MLIRGALAAFTPEALTAGSTAKDARAGGASSPVHTLVQLLSKSSLANGQAGAVFRIAAAEAVTAQLYEAFSSAEQDKLVQVCTRAA